MKYVLKLSSENKSVFFKYYFLKEVSNFTTREFYYFFFKVHLSLNLYLFFLESNFPNIFVKLSLISRNKINVSKNVNFCLSNI